MRVDGRDETLGGNCCSRPNENDLQNLGEVASIPRELTCRWSPLLFSAALTLSYGAFVAFHHAHPRRTSSEVRAWLNDRDPESLRVIGWAGVVATCAICLYALGVSRGIAVWLGVLSVAAAASLVCVTLRPRWHLRSVPAVAAVAVTGELLRRLV